MFRRFRFSVRSLWISITAICAYFGISSLTITWGVHDVVETAVAQCDTSGKRLDHDPYRSPGLSPDPPWYFVGNGSSPCPFIVGVDWGVLHAPMAGTGGRSYFLWFLGVECRIPFFDKFYWIS